MQSTCATPLATGIQHIGLESLGAAKSESMACDSRFPENHLKTAAVTSEWQLLLRALYFFRDSIPFITHPRTLILLNLIGISFENSPVRPSEGRLNFAQFKRIAKCIAHNHRPVLGGFIKPGQLLSVARVP